MINQLLETKEPACRRIKRRRIKMVGHPKNKLARNKQEEAIDSIERRGLMTLGRMNHLTST